MPTTDLSPLPSPHAKLVTQCSSTISRRRALSRSGMTLLEVMISSGMLLLMLGLLAYTLTQSERLFHQTSGRDDAVRQMLLARSALTRDLQSASSAAGQFAYDHAPEHLAGAGFDGDALTFLSADDGQHTAQWTVNSSTGEATLQSEITYWLAVPGQPDPSGVVAKPGPPLDGYDQQNPCKWLVRRRDDCPALVAGHPTPEIAPLWSSWLIQPTGNSPQSELIARNLLSFRVRKAGGIWNFELSAVAIEDARHRLALGSVPLTTTPYTLQERFSVVVAQ